MCRPYVRCVCLAVGISGAIYSVCAPVTISVRFLRVVVCWCVIWRFVRFFVRLLCVLCFFLSVFVRLLCVLCFFVAVFVRFSCFFVPDLFVVCGAVSLSYLLVFVSRGRRLFSFLIYVDPRFQAC